MATLEKRLLLIEPPFYRLYNPLYSLSRLPQSLGYLAGAVKRDTDWNVRIFNSDFSKDDIPIDLKYLCGEGFKHYMSQLKNIDGSVWQSVRLMIEHYHPTVVGISSKSQNFTSACIVAKIAKSVDPKITVIVGGPHPSIIKKDVLKHASIDIAVFGEGEETLVDLLATIEGKKKLEDVPGIVFRSANNICETATRPFIKDLNALYTPIKIAATTLEDYEHFPTYAFNRIFSTRGCPFNCSFCGSRYVWNHKVRCRSVASIVAEVREITKLGVKIVNFDDDIFGASKPYLNELCDALRENFPDLQWTCEMHVGMLDASTIKNMKRSGCYEVRLGVESGNNDMLKLIRKGFKIDKACKIAKMVRKYGIFLNAYFIVGYPQETRKSLADTIAVMKTFPCDKIVYSIFTPYPGTELFDYCLEQGILTNEFDVSQFNHQSPANYFCPSIPHDEFVATLRSVEGEITEINRKKRFSYRYLFNTVLNKFRKIIRHTWHIERLAIYN